MQALHKPAWLSYVIFSILTAGCGGVNPSTSETKVIYGDDDRLDLYDTKLAPALRTLAQSTVALVKKSDLTATPGSNLFKLPGTTLGAANNVCSSEPFANQPSPAFCSGFLVGPDLIASAGHCITNASDCASVAYVFDFGLLTRENNVTQVSSENIYYCKEIVATQAPNAGADFSIVRLDRKVIGRLPLAFRADGKIADNAPLVVIGHPSGLPTKVAGGAAVRSNTPADFFVTNLDTYGGNSGSAVFHAQTGLVEGILVRGEQDYVFSGGCYVSNRCTSTACRGEDVTRATAFAKFVIGQDPPPPPPNPTGTTREYSYSALALRIPDNSSIGVTKEIVVAQAGNLGAISVEVKIKHPYIGDLLISLVAPSGVEMVLRNRSGGSSDDINGVYGLGGIAVTALDSLKGKPVNGTWKLIVRDRAAADLGTVNTIKLTLKTLAPAATTQ